MAARDNITAMAEMPPEILQAVWSQLPFTDLLRYQRVCKKWKSYLPGNNSALRRILFAPDTYETVSNAPPVNMFIAFTQHLELRQKDLSRLRFSIDFKETDFSWICRENSTRHPIIGTPWLFGDLIHPSFQPRSPRFAFVFYNLDDVKVLKTSPTSKGASWEMMLACVPKVQELKIQVQCGFPHAPSILDTINSATVKNLGGVRVLDVVRVIRAVLRIIEVQLRTQCCQMDQIASVIPC